MKKTEKESIQFYLPAVLKRKAERLAHKNYMSVTAYLIKLLKEAK